MLGFSAFLAVAAPAYGQSVSSQAQAVPAWQTATGGKMAFEVASIRLAEPGTFTPPSFALNIDDTPIPQGGRFSADFPLSVYIEFAYKLMLTHEEQESLVAHLPKWVAADYLVIEARAEGNPTKDQMRLMMQSLLADRFRLAVHFETQEVPVFALVLDKPGKIGPRLRLHAEGLACDAKWVAPPDRSSTAVAPGGFMPVCDAVAMIPGQIHTVMFGARELTLKQLAQYLPSILNQGRPVVDETGLDGTFDFSLNWTPEYWLHESDGGTATGPQLDAPGTSLLEALKEQLGLKLKATRAPVKILVIDHVEPPSPN
ncbi:MAG: TIGR03435 family protein [Terracidiphilus sp.]